MVDADTFLIPFIKAMNAFVYFDAVVPSQGMQTGYVRQFAQGSVRFGAVPSQFSPEAHFADNHFGSFADADLLAGTNVDVAVADLAK